MKKSKIRILICLMAVVSCTAAFSVNALAYSEETTSPTLSSSSAAQSSTASSSASSATSSGTSLKPLTPDGTGTVIDNVTNEDGKEFFTITTPSKHVFYLIIDRQKNAENVYFLDAVTDKDLLALAKSDNEDVSGSSSSKTVSSPEVSSAPTASTPTVSSVSQPEKQNNSAGIAAVAVLAAVLAGAAVWFFKFRKPDKKDKNRPDPDDYDYTDGGDDESEPDDEPEAPDEEATQKDGPESSDGETEREDE
ncbi:CD1107 family mobile element protein [Ethanoligenens sp.]|jgi:flagellar basal body-associated protein FliL|uniref:CD1107 family mobile element protein n=1 Tax=Ethanoligenens sp. TaxID=2099655 RepID=UPI0039E8F731